MFALFDVAKDIHIVQRDFADILKKVILCYMNIISTS